MELVGSKGQNALYLLLLFSLLSITQTCPNIEIVPRSEWSTKPPDYVVSINRPVEHLFISHTVTPQCHSKEECSQRMRQMQQYHMNLEWGDIGYNFVIGGDGRVYKGVGWTREGAHTYRWNSKSYGIAFVGNFMATRPNDSMLRAARMLIVCGIKKGYIAEDRLLHGARDATCTASPGDVLYEIIKHWPRFQGGPLSVYSCF